MSEMQNPFSRLSPELIQNIAGFMHTNDIATGFKLACQEVAAALRAQHRVIQLRGEPRTLRSANLDTFAVAIAAHPWPGAAFVAHWGRPEPWRALPRWPRHRLLCLAASSRHPPSLEAALAHCGTAIETDALESAIIAHDLAACRWLFETEGCDWKPEWQRERIPAVAGLAGSVPVCRWLWETVPQHELNVAGMFLSNLCYAGHSGVVEWVLEEVTGGLPHNRNNYSFWPAAAAAGGRLELLQQLASRFPFDPEGQNGVPVALADVAYGCPLAVLQRYYDPWGAAVGLLEKAGQKLHVLLCAAASPTPD